MGAGRAVNLALLDIRRNVGRFIGTSFGIALLFTVVLAMAGIYQGLVDDATVLLRSVHANLWVVQKGTRGPFADPSRLDPTVEARVASVAGTRRTRSFTYQVLQRDVGKRSLRFALIGLSWPDDDGRALTIIRGRAIEQAHSEIIVDASLGLPVGSTMKLATEEFRVVGVTRQMLGSGGDAVVCATISDAQLIAEDAPPDVVRTERERRAERLRAIDLGRSHEGVQLAVRAIDLGRSQPALENLVFDPAFRPPALASSFVHAVLVDVDGADRLETVRSTIATWPDVSVYTTDEQERLLLDGVVDKPRRQLGLFSLILVITSSVLISAIVYTMTLDKTHHIAVLKLMGAPPSRIAAMVIQQAWLMGILGYAIAVAIGSEAFPYFPRRVVLTQTSIALVGALVLVVSTFASLLGVAYALRVDAGRALEG